ncbi:uncharacterized protein Pp2C1 [Battus philenor]|uniref:uncharacterized protein Pp2C1 n=1 Tax=Battus philenor TaxID=42288 RepID=UPI0035CF6635
MPPSIGVNLRVTGHCSQGGRKYMEDLFSVAYQQTEDERDLEYAFFGIYDGHGGSEAAAFAKEHLMDSIVKQRQFWSDDDEDVLKAIRNGYMLTHLNMWKELEKWPKTVTGLPSTAGTTASVAFIRRGKIYVGHVGDSAIVLGYQKEGSEEWAAKPLTSDHKPEATMEIERIQKCGGKVITKAGVPRVVWNRPRLGHKGPIKKNTPMDEIPFLAVARSLGDLWSYNPQNDEFIVSPDPDVGVLTIDPSKFRCLIFGTDGLWNMISPEGAVSLVQATERHNEAALVGGGANQPRDWLNPSKSLVDHALERWSNTRMRADNTSVVTLMLDPPGPPRATVLRSRTGAAHRTHAAHSPQAPAPAHAPTPSATPAVAPAATSAAVAHCDADTRQVPQNGLTIMTRYSDVEKPQPPADNAERSPLPPCATLDGRFSVPSREESPREPEEDAITNYGNPAESYFMARLLNRTRVVNTLSDVYDEIANGRKAAPDALESALTTPVPAAGGDAARPLAPDPQPERRARSAGDAPAPEPDADGGIQINEVSSSSPADAPRPRARRARRDAAPHDRVLRSHPQLESDAPARPPARPHTRQARGKHVDRVVILTRRPDRAAASPAPAPAAAPAAADDEARRTRSQLAPGNCARAPGSRRAAAAHCKENLCAGRTRARPAPAPRPRARRLPSDEVHSTTGWARALRSRNAAAPTAQPASSAQAAPPPAKRARCEPAAGGQRATWPALALRERLRRRLGK